jgi:hypothetical protein
MARDAHETVFGCGEVSASSPTPGPSSSGRWRSLAVFPNPLTCVLAVMLIGSRQLGLAILMHEGAHRCFSRNESRNMALSQWLCAYPIFADTQAYRRYHLQHHPHTQQEDDPDLVLSAPFPITQRAIGASFCATSRAAPVTSSARRSSSMRSAIRPGRSPSAPAASAKSSETRSRTTRCSALASRWPASGGPIPSSGWSRCSHG